MDPFAHFSVGASLGVIFFKDQLEVFFGEKYSLFIAVFIGGVLGILPDIDVFNKRKSYILYMEKHRKWTHSIFTHVLLALVLGFLLNYYILGIEYGFLFSLLISSLYVFLILFSHNILDLLTSWGVYLFYPIKKEFATRSVFVIDFFFDGLMLIQLIFLCFSKLSFSPFYIAITYLVYAFLLRNFFIVPFFKKKLREQGIVYSELEVKPTFLNTIIWAINVRVKEGYMTGYYSIFQMNSKVTFFKYSVNPEQLNYYNDPRLIKLIRRFKKVVGDWYAISKVDNNFYIHDVRYGFKTFDINETRYAQSYLVKEENKILDLVLEQEPVRGWILKLIKRMFID